MSELMLDMFFNSTFPEEELEKERNVITEEKKMYEDDAGAYFWSRFSDELMLWDKGHDIIGTFDTISKINRNDIVSFLDGNIGSDTTVLIFSGKLDTEEIKKNLEDCIPLGHRYLTARNREPLSKETWKEGFWSKDKINFKCYKEGIEQSMVYMLNSGVDSFTEDIEAQVIMSKVLGGGMYSVMFSEIREKLGLCYSCGFGGYNYDGLQNLLYGYCYTSPENIEEFMDATERIFKDVLRDGIDEDIFICAKNDLLSSVISGTETSKGKANYHVKGILNGNYNSIDSKLTRLREVTVGNCNDLMHKLLDKDNHCWVALYPEK
jgi:predicted Zn-dependent peptidase